MAAAATTVVKEKIDGRPWVEKFRPETLNDVVAHEQILDTLKRLMSSDTLPHLLFYGPPGTGKTTTIHACARHLFGAGRMKGNVLELNASDDRGIDIVRNQIRDFASTGSLMMGFTSTAGGAQPSAGRGIKLVVLDEADQMSNEAQAALRRIIEKYTKTVRFCILCNHVNKIIPAIQSRCTRFRFAPLKEKQMLPRLMQVTAGEGYTADVAGLKAAFKLSGGDMRRCLNILQAAALATGKLTEDTIYATTGNPTPTEVQTVIAAMMSKEFEGAWEDVSGMMTIKGLSTADLIREMHPMIALMDLPQDSKCFLFVKLADIEYYLAAGTGENSALAAVIGAMQTVREAVSRGQPVSSFGPIAAVN
jgi:replication factor C subunit 3/5